MKQETIDNNFTYHPPEDCKVIKYEEIRAIGKDMAETLTILCPPGRDLETAITRLEESIMWANASIARGE
jgi:hypothetical protein